MMEPIHIRRSVADQIAAHYVANVDELGAQSVKELTALYGASESTVHQAMRLADGLLAATGRTLTVAEGRTGWRIAPTSSELEFAVSTRGRVTAMLHEVSRYRTKGAATGERDEHVSRAFSDCEAALELAAEALVEIAV